MHRTLVAARAVSRTRVASRQWSPSGRPVLSSLSRQPSAFTIGATPWSQSSLNRTAVSSSFNSAIISRSFSWTPWSTEETSVEGVGATQSTSTAIQQTPATPAAAVATPVENTTAVHTSLPAASEIPETAALLPQSPASGSVPSLAEMIAENPTDIQAVLNSPEAINAVMQLGDLKLIGLDHGILNPAGYIRDIMAFAHVETGLPWWGTIMLVTVFLRAAIFPLVIRVQKNNVRMQAIQPQSTSLMNKMKAAQAVGDKATTQVYGHELTKLWKDNDCNPWKSMILPLVQMPLFMSFFFAIRKMAVLPLPQLKEGGIGWVTDLTIPDPFYILPVTSMALTLAVLEIGADGTGGAAKTRQMMHFTNFFRVASIFAIPFVGKMPAALLFYWTFSNFITLCQAFFLKQQPVRRLLGIPTPTPAPPPPAGTIIEKDPTMMDTWRAARDYFMKTHKDALSRAQKTSTGSTTVRSQFKDVIRETQAAASGTTVKPVVATTTSKIAAQTVKKVSSPVLDAVADEKAQRIAAARERRNRRS